MALGSLGALRALGELWGTLGNFCGILTVLLLLQLRGSGPFWERSGTLGNSGEFWREGGGGGGNSWELWCTVGSSRELLLPSSSSFLSSSSSPATPGKDYFPFLLLLPPSPLPSLLPLPFPPLPPKRITSSSLSFFLLLLPPLLLPPSPFPPTPPPT